MQSRARPPNGTLPQQPSQGRFHSRTEIQQAPGNAMSSKDTDCLRDTGVQAVNAAPLAYLESETDPPGGKHACTGGPPRARSPLASAVASRLHPHCSGSQSAAQTSPGGREHTRLQGNLSLSRRVLVLKAWRRGEAAPRTHLALLLQRRHIRTLPHSLPPPHRTTCWPAMNQQVTVPKASSSQRTR